jgi:hypothetical protein
MGRRGAFSAAQGLAGPMFLWTAAPKLERQMSPAKRRPMLESLFESPEIVGKRMRGSTLSRQNGPKRSC